MKFVINASLYFSIFFQVSWCYFLFCHLFPSLDLLLTSLFPTTQCQFLCHVHILHVKYNTSKFTVIVYVEHMTIYCIFGIPNVQYVYTVHLLSTYVHWLNNYCSVV